MKKFAIVKDYEDLVTGGIIPRKVLEGMPVNIGGPIIRPMPIKKYPGIEISPVPTLSPFSPFSSLSMNSPSFAKMGPSGPVIYPGVNQPTRQVILGRPIIKATPIMQSGSYINVIVKYLGNDYTLRIPINRVRRVIDDIYSYEITDNEIKNISNPVSFKIITPSWTSVVRTSPEKMITLLRRLRDDYPTVTYLYNGNYVNLNRLPIISSPITL